ncbi:hypothetical protein FKM82_020595 [Ascaphus truei]
MQCIYVYHKHASTKASRYPSSTGPPDSDHSGEELHVALAYSCPPSSVQASSRGDTKHHICGFQKRDTPATT